MQLGAALVLGGMLVAAGVPKAAVPWYVASALRRVVRTGSDRALLLAGRLLGCWEVALGLALPLVYSGPAAVAVAACAVLTFAAFTGFVAAAIRRGAACGCWASLSEGPAGGAELARAAFLAVLAVALLAARLSWHGTGWPTPNPPVSNPPVPNLPVPNLPVPKGDAWPAQGWALPGWPAPSGATLVSAAALLAVLWLATRLGAAVLPVRTATLRRRLQAQSAPGRAGQLAGQLALLAGFVSAGTRAGRRRYRAARATAGQAAPAGPSSIRRATSTLPPRPTPAAPAVPAQVVPALVVPALVVPALAVPALVVPALAVPAPVVPALAAMAATTGSSR
jgi:hypothetical protein